MISLGSAAAGGNMRESEYKLKVLGTRGSMAVDGKGYALFGGATSCYQITAGEETIFLDAGTGLSGAQIQFPKTPVILLSHLHLDHILGLGMYPRLSTKGLRTRICVPTEEGVEPESIINRLYSPPFWPVSLEKYAGDVIFEPLSLPMETGKVRIEGMEGNHPGGCLIMKITYEGRSIVYATDYEHEDKSFSELIEFSRGASLVLYDGQYNTQEYEKKKGFGHSTAKKGLELLEKSGAERMLIIHHDTLNTDEFLLKQEMDLLNRNFSFARQGEIIRL